MSFSLKRQDLPPSGGYAPINYKRIPSKAFFTGWVPYAVCFVFSSIGIGLYSLTYFLRTREDVEKRSARMAIYPLLLAEKDRAIMRQMRKNRDYEAELMKDVKGWEVGTLFGERVFRSLPEDSFVYPNETEMYAHASQKDFWMRYETHHKI